MFKFEMVGPKGKDFDIVGCWLCAARNCLKGLSGDEMTGLLIFRTAGGIQFHDHVPSCWTASWMMRAPREWHVLVSMCKRRCMNHAFYCLS